MERSRASVRRMIIYFGIAFALTWSMWLLVVLASRHVLSLPASATFPVLVVGSFGPFFAAFIALAIDGGSLAVFAFGARALRFRIGVSRLLAALFLLPALGAAAAFVYSRQTGTAFALETSIAHLPFLLLELFLIGGSVGEEFGWAYAIDAMQQVWKPLRAAVILGATWGCWHLPLFFIPGLSQSHMPFWAFLILTVSLRVLYVWAYDGSRKSILAPLLFHTSANLTFNLYTIVNSHGTDERCFIYFALFTAGAAIVITATSPMYRPVATPRITTLQN